MQARVVKEKPRMNTAPTKYRGLETANIEGIRLSFGSRIRG